MRIFYECNNPDCGLRFPDPSRSPKRNRCPRCRSQIHEVALVVNEQERIKPIEVNRKWQMEVLLDNLRSAWNVGSIFRTADGIGINKIYCCGISPTPENQKVKKTSLGAENKIPWVWTANGVKTASDLKSQGYSLWALEDIPEASPFNRVNIPDNTENLVLIVGSETCGVDPGIIELCNRVLYIPMVGSKHSYNVAIAFGIAASFLIYR